MPPRRKSPKSPKPPNEDEIFKVNYMQALNDKFKLRAQLAALRNQLENITTRNDRLTDEIQDKQDNLTDLKKRYRISNERQKRKPTEPEESEVEHIDVASEPEVDVEPEYEPAAEEVDDLEEESSESVVVQAEESIESVPETEIVYDDHVVVVKRRVPSSQAAQRVPTDNGALEMELKRLQKKFEDITFYAIAIIVILFSIMILKEIKVLFIHKSANPGQPGEGLVIDDTQAKYKLGSQAEEPANRSMQESMSPPQVPSPPPPQVPNIVQPVNEAKLTESTYLQPEMYDCADCNHKMKNITKSFGDYNAGAGDATLQHSGRSFDLM